jgi:hypothetical protein
MIESNLLIVKDVHQWISTVPIKLLRERPAAEYKTHGVAESSAVPIFD